MTLKVVINAHWESIGTHIQDALKVWNDSMDKGGIELSIVPEETNYTDIPFIQTGDNFGRISYQIDREWYKREITPRGWGYDLIAFVVPQNQWKGDGIGGITSWNAGRYEIEFTADENQKYPAVDMLCSRTALFTSYPTR